MLERVATGFTTQIVAIYIVAFGVDPVALTASPLDHHFNGLLAHDYLKT